MKRYILAMFATALISMPASAIEGPWGAICVTGTDCEGATTEAVSGTITREDTDVEDRKFDFKIDYVNDDADLCRYVFKISYDEAVTKDFRATIALESGAGLGDSKVNAVCGSGSNEAPSESYPANDHRYLCRVEVVSGNPGYKLPMNDETFDATITTEVWITKARTGTAGLAVEY